MKPVSAFVGLGANLGNPTATLKQAVADLRALPSSRLCGLSSLFRSAPVGPAGQDDYLNAVARLETRLAPHALLAALQAIEEHHGRVRSLRWGPRTLDLDLLLYGSDCISTADLRVPHPELRNRNFVVIPLLQACPDARLPDGTPVASLAVSGSWSGLAEVCAGPAWGD